MTARSSSLVSAAFLALIGACIESRAPADNDEGASGAIMTEKDAAADDASMQVDSGSKLAGTGLMCTSWQEAPAGKCYGYWCGVDYELLRAETMPGGTCQGDEELELICEGAIVEKIAQCARDNALTGTKFEENVVSCIRKEKTYDVVTDACLACYTASAKCALDECINECVAGDSQGCDDCRMEHGCTQGWYTCSGVPTVF
jgi:hypothetical protein